MDQTIFTNIDKRTIEATKKLIESGLLKEDVSTNRKIKICKEWLETVSKNYGIKVPKFRFDKSEEMSKEVGGGCYDAVKERIILCKKFSLINLLQLFIFHMIHELDLPCYEFEWDSSKAARAWALNIFKATAPELYKNAVEKGLLDFDDFDFSDFY